ncbi:MAG: XrtA-associated tyrosine autokinase [Dissulfurispiraceae bacterium]|jgi:exopolysaccharide/PEP-CTERM locus tyrosine autokinase|nr:XrtA-associated tyrosine autokinase [Dissulfurispiraceae bacterium]
MSKIEKALQKAMETRGSQADSPKPQNTRQHDTRQQPAADTHVFEATAMAVDPAIVDRHVICITEPFSVIAEQYKRMRAKILRDTSRENRNIMMVTSANMSEGKSITAANLAVSIAQDIDHTVLLVDTDLRRPSLHAYFGLDPKYGLSDYLQGTKELPEVLIKTGIGKLVFLPAGQAVENPSELLASTRMRELVQEMKNRYKDRYVIFDTSPLLVTADSISMSRYMDGIIFVVQSDQTHKKDAAKALSMVKGVPIIGVVMNDVPEYLSSDKNDYYRYGYYTRPTAGASKSDQ